MASASFASNCFNLYKTWLAQRRLRFNFIQSLILPESLTPVTNVSSIVNPNSFTSCSSHGDSRLGQVMMIVALSVNTFMEVAKVVNAKKTRIERE